MTTGRPISSASTMASDGERATTVWALIIGRVTGVPPNNALIAARRTSMVDIACAAKILPR